MPSRQARLPVLNSAKTKGWHFLLAWFHRISGILLVILSCFSIYYLSTVSISGFDQRSAQTLESLTFIVLLLIFLIPVVSHALNGGRLILYEIIG